MHLEHLDLTAGLWTYRLADDDLLVVGRRQPADRDTWQAADRERPLYLRLADLTAVDDTGIAVLTHDWRHRALAFANLYAPPAGGRHLALARVFPLRLFASEALVLRWALHLQGCLPNGPKRSRTEAAKAAVQIRALIPEVPEGSVLVHPPDRQTGEPPTDGDGQMPASLSADEVQRRLRELHARAGSSELWNTAADALASLINLRLVGVTPICLPRRGRSGLPQPGLGFTFPSPRARIWYGLWQDAVGMRVLDCDWCHKPFLVTRASQRFCSKNCQSAAGVERYRRRRHERDEEEP